MRPACIFYLCQFWFLLNKVIGFLDEPLKTILVGFDLRLKRLVTHPLAVDVLGLAVSLVLSCKHLLCQPVAQLSSTHNIQCSTSHSLNITTTRNASCHHTMHHVTQLKFCNKQGKRQPTVRLDLRCCNGLKKSPETNTQNQHNKSSQSKHVFYITLHNNVSLVVTVKYFVRHH